MSDTVERRRSVLTDDDFKKIEASIERSWTRWAEAIGMDVSTPAARVEIRKDQEFVRDWRTGTYRARIGMLMLLGVAIITSIGKWVWDAVWHAIQIALRAKGAS